MKNLSVNRWFKNLNKQQRDMLLWLAIALAFAVVYYFLWAFYLTSVPDSKVNIDNPQKYFWWANDSRSYRNAAEWLFGREDNASIISRPWLYPFMLGLSKTLFRSHAETILWLGQFMMWLVSGAFIYLSLQNNTRSTMLSIAGTMLFFLHPSPLVLTFHGMTETLNIFLVTILCWILTTNRANRILIGILLLSLLTVTKPIYQVQLGLLIIYFLWQDVNSSRLKQAGLIALALIPVWIQLSLTFINSGTPTISTIGKYTFKNYTVALVYSRVENLEWRPSMKAIESWGTKEQLGYLWDHPRETLLTYRANLIDGDFWTGSIFALGQGNRMAGFAKAFNYAWACIHLLALPLIVYYLLSPKYKNKEFVSLVYASLLIQTLITGISSGQGDRLILPMMPMWIIVYISALRHICTAKTEPLNQ